jgi:hypothetical protein
MFKKFSLTCLFFATFTSFQFVYCDTPQIKVVDENQALEEPGACFFIPPKNWGLIGQELLLDDVKIMVIGKPLSFNHLPPSINLAIENTYLTQDEYIAVVEENNKKEHDTLWSNIGKIQSKAGLMTLTQLDIKTSWGEARLFQAILVKKGKAYVLTTTAQLNEFAHFSEEFQKSIESFQINKDIYQLVSDKNKRKDLKNLVKIAKKKWQEDLQIAKNLQPDLTKNELAKKTFESNVFQTQVWHPLKTKIGSSFDYLGTKWQEKFFSILKDELLSIE